METLSEQSRALVIGASGAIGSALVEHLLAHTPIQRVWAASSQPASARLMSLAERYGDRLRTLEVDITEATSIQRMGEDLAAEAKPLHLLINAFGFLHDERAGIWPEKRLEDISPEGLEANFRINTMAPMLIARHCLGLLNHRERAVFATLSARVGSIGDNRLGGWYAYRSSKAAQNMFTRGLAIECGRRARRVICLALHPGTTDSGLSRPFQARVPENKLFTPAFVAEKLLTRIDRARLEDSGGFFAWDGQPIPW